MGRYIQLALSLEFIMLPHGDTYFIRIFSQLSLDNLRPQCRTVCVNGLSFFLEGRRVLLLGNLWLHYVNY